MSERILDIEELRRNVEEAIEVSDARTTDAVNHIWVSALTSERYKLLTSLKGELRYAATLSYGAGTNRENLVMVRASAWQGYLDRLRSIIGSW